MKFTKMQGLGNDYIYVNCFVESVENPGELSKKLSDRHFGVGSDGLILICPSQIADFRMDMYNSDGSGAEMCGNGIRCVGKYVYDRGLTDKETVTVETGAGVKTLLLDVKDGAVDFVTVDMGVPMLEPSKIPVLSERDSFIGQPMKVESKTYLVTCVSMGNPHAVIFCDDVDKLNLPELGPKFENHPLFPKRINTEFVQAIDRERLKMRVWERGAGETLACGTGASASLVAAVLNDICERSVKMHLLGGILSLQWNSNDNHVYMTGPAEFVFDGEVK